jgi:hypothetical protein
MIWFSLLFLLSTIYYLFNRVRLNTDLVKRNYIKKYLILLDIFYYITELSYFIWIILLYFYYLNFSIIMTLFLILNWFLNRNEKIDNFFTIIKIILLLLIFCW